jgi:hypothetical protein
MRTSPPVETPGVVIQDMSEWENSAMQETDKILRSAAKNTQRFSPKDRIDHSHFGLGTIVEIDERYATIEFDETGTRRFVTGMLRVVPSDTPRPPRRRRTAKRVNRSG